MNHGLIDILRQIRRRQIDIVTILHHHIFQKEGKRTVIRRNLNEGGLTKPNVVEEINFSRFGIPFRVKKDFFKIKGKPHPKNRVIKV